jgi:hypothetical protein
MGQGEIVLTAKYLSNRENDTDLNDLPMSNTFWLRILVVTCILETAYFSHHFVRSKFVKTIGDVIGSFRTKELAGKSDRIASLDLRFLSPMRYRKQSWRNTIFITSFNNPGKGKVCPGY